jgi:hypothetical protein
VDDVTTSRRLCPYVVAWLGRGEVEGNGGCSTHGEFSFIEGENLIVLPSVRLPGHAFLAGLGWGPAEPFLIDLTRVAMMAKRRLCAPCIACEDGVNATPATPGRKFEILLAILRNALKMRSELGPPRLLGTLESWIPQVEATAGDLADACAWLDELAIEHMRAHQYDTVPVCLSRTVESRIVGAV